MEFVEAHAIGECIVNAQLALIWWPVGAVLVNILHIDWPLAVIN